MATKRALIDALRGALAFVELHTGSGVRVPGPDWSRQDGRPDGDYLPEVIAARARRVLRQEATRARFAGLVDDFRNASASPRDAGMILELIAERMREDAAELRGAWQETGAGSCWDRAADRIDKAAAVLQVDA
jgi:hypothetical protein